MRFSDIGLLAIQTVWQQKVRTVLNLAGVVIGAFIFVFTFAAGSGIEQTVIKLLSKEDYLRSIMVSPSYDFADEAVPEDALIVNDEMSEEKKERIRKRLKRKWRQRNDYRSFQPITSREVAAMERIAHVESVTPGVSAECSLTFDGHHLTSTMQGIRPHKAEIQDRIVAGSDLSETSEDEMLLNEFLAYQLGFQTDTQMDSLIGCTVTVQFRLRNMRLDYMLQYAAERRRSQESSRGDADSNEAEESSSADATSDSTTEGDLDEDPLSFEERSRLIEEMSNLPELMEQHGIDRASVDLIRQMLQDRPEEEAGESTEPTAGPEFIRRDMRVVGIVRDRNPGEQRVGLGMWFMLGGTPDILMPVDVATSIAQQMPSHVDEGFPSVTVVVADESRVEEVAAQIEEMGLQQNSLLQFVKFLREQIAVGKFIMACIAAVVFLVSGMGIANTMIMSVMERTYEIGVMKAVGARNRHILAIFLGEGCLIGVLGSLLAVGLALLTASLLDGIAQQRLSSRLGVEIEPPIFIFSTQLILTVIAFSSLVTLIATAIPAWRAARIDPIAALRSR